MSVHYPCSSHFVLCAESNLSFCLSRSPFWVKFHNIVFLYFQLFDRERNYYFDLHYSSRKFLRVQ